MKRELRPGTVMVPCPVVLVSVGDDHQANIITLSWAANISSRPPRMAIGVRPERHSYGLLQRVGDFVINIPSTDLIEAAVTCGTKSGRDINKFETCNLTAKPASQITSPMITECPLNIECKTWKIIDAGSHHLFIGDVMTVHIDENILDKEGEPQLSKLNLFAYITLTREFWAINKFLRPW